MSRRVMFEGIVVVAVLVTAIISLVMAVNNDGESAMGWLITLTVVSALGCAVGLRASTRNQHGLAAVGFLVGIVAPTFFFYIFNLVLIVVAIYEGVLFFRQRSSSKA